MRFELVLFDCDGVLIDSERIWNRIFAETLNALGASLTLEYMYEHFLGLSWPGLHTKVVLALGREPPPDLEEIMMAKTRLAFAAELAAVPGIESVLDTLTLPFCVVSNSDRERIRENLGHTGLLRRFEGRIFTGREVARPKPAPDVYLHAARTLGVDPAACLVIEDTPVGASAGLAAGMTVAGYAAHTPAKRLVEAGVHGIFASMVQLPALIRKLGEARRMEMGGEE